MANNGIGSTDRIKDPVEMVEYDDKMVQSFIGSNKDASKALANLTPYQASFVIHFAKSDDMALSINKARASHGLTTYPLDKAYEEASLMMLKNDVKNAVADINKAKVTQLQSLAINLGVDKLMKSFTEASTRQNSLDEMDKHIEILKSQIVDIQDAIKIIKTSPGYDVMQVMKLNREIENKMSSIESKIKTRDSLQESIRKNLQTVSDMTNTSKEKVTVKAGAINIVVGSQNNPIDIVDANVTEHVEEVFEID